MWRDSTQLSGLIRQHLSRRPRMQPRDVYKLLYQGVLGPEHIISSPQTFASYLLTELNGLADQPDTEPLTEPVRPDGALLRLNLRAFKSQEGNFDALLSACLETAQRKWGSLADLHAAWQVACELCQQGQLPGMSYQVWLSFSAWLREQGFPAVHHSQEYRELYHPAYRLVASNLLPLDSAAAGSMR